MSQDDTEEESEQLIEEDVEWRGGMAYVGSMKLSRKMQEKIEELVEARLETTLEGRLNEVLEKAFARIRLSSGIDSASIAALICGLVAIVSGVFGIQATIEGNVPVGQALVWVVTTSILGLAILLYAKATRG